MPAGLFRTPVASPPLTLRYRRLTPRYVPDLLDLLGRLAVGGDDRFFHPHPCSNDVVTSLAAPGRLDEYHVVIAGRGGPAIAYGMLRGWEEGYAVPSLGLAVDRQWRGLGVGRQFLLHLHAVAAARGARHVRLKVSRDNATAINLYRSVGYSFQPHSADEWLAFFDLADAPLALAA